METLTAVQTLRELVRENGQKLFDNKQIYAFRLDEHAVLAICECGCGALTINIDGNGPLHISDDEKEASEILEIVRIMGLSVSWDCLATSKTSKPSFVKSVTNTEHKPHTDALWGAKKV
jgi:hypothetical protein